MIWQKKSYRLKIPNLIRRILVAWLLATVIEYLHLPSQLRDLSSLDGLAQMSLPRILAITCIGTGFLCLLSCFIRTRTIERWSLPCIFAALAAAVLWASFSWAFLGVSLLILALLTVYSVRGWDSSPEPIAKAKPAHRAYLWLTAAFTVLFFLLVSAWTVGRVLSFSAPTYDFGIFSQMFYNMKTSGLPMTTLERDGLLSHFHVHMSPIYYLMLPFYCLAPTPATLQVLQAAVIASSVIPLWKIGKHRSLSGAQRMCLCLLLLLLPAFSGGTGYDIHENCFLTPLLLWLFYGIDRKNTAITAISALLTLTVKEDAAVYVAVIALWLTVKTVLRCKKPDIKNLVTGIAMLAASLLWFFLVTKYLAEVGDGVMTYRYDNFLYDGSKSLVTVVKSVLLSPMKTLYECVDTEKLYYIAMTLLPFLGLPLLTRRYERYILLIPYILVNLMSDYTYQHDIFFQYGFGSTACLIYLTAVNLADMKINWQRTLAFSAAAAVSAACFCMVTVPRAMRYPLQCIQYSDYYQNIRSALSQIPESASVSATTFYTTYLSQRETLYDVSYASQEHLLSTDYIVLTPTADYKKYEKSQEDGYQNLINLLKENGYTLLTEIPNTLTVYRRTASPISPTYSNRGPVYPSASTVSDHICAGRTQSPPSPYSAR